MIDIKNLPRKGSNLERFQRGQIIIREGEAECDKMHILLKGSADVYKNYQEPGEIKIATLKQGDFFGEMSLFLDRTRTATVIASEEVTTLVLNHTNAHVFFTEQPEAKYSLIQTLCARLVNTNINMSDNHAKYEKNITSLNCKKKELEIAANIDALTGVFNRRYFMETSGTWIENMLEKNKKSFVVMLDLDHFKKVNDTYGHQAGDIVLKSVANTISCAIRSSDLFARYGGEEFVLLISAVNKKAAMGLVERIRQRIRKEPVEFENECISVSASFGIAAILPEYNFNAVISFADEALYRAKSGGRDRTVFYEPQAMPGQIIRQGADK